MIRLVQNGLNKLKWVGMLSGIFKMGVKNVFLFTLF